MTVVTIWEKAWKEWKKIYSLVGMDAPAPPIPPQRATTKERVLRDYQSKAKG